MSNQTVDKESRGAEGAGLSRVGGVTDRRQGFGLAHCLLGILVVLSISGAWLGSSLNPGDSTQVSYSAVDTRDVAAASRGSVRETPDEVAEPIEPTDAPSPNDAEVSEPDTPTPTSDAPGPGCGGYASHQATACAILAEYGFDSGQMSCLAPLWEHESGWNPQASNPSSGAHGIPQALPGNKMATAGPDWQTNAATQIRWGLGYIKDRYQNPCGAWDFWLANNWY